MSTEPRSRVILRAFRSEAGTAWAAAGLYLVAWVCLSAALAAVLPRLIGVITALEVWLVAVAALALSYGGLGPALAIAWEGLRWLSVEGGQR